MFQPTPEEAESEDLLKLWTSPKFMNQSIIDQGNKIRQLKADKAAKVRASTIGLYHN